MAEQPDWFIKLQRDLNAPVMVPDGAIIDWDRCRDRFLVLLLQRLEKRTTSPHPAMVRRLLEQRLAGDAVIDELFAAKAADLAAEAAALAAAEAAAAKAAANTDWAAEAEAQWGDLRRAVEASTTSDGLTAAQHRDVLRGGPDPRSPAPGDGELEQLIAWLHKEADDYGCIGVADSAARCNRVAALLQQQAATIADLEAVIAAWAQGPAPVPVADRPWEQPGWCDAEGRCWMGRRRIGNDPGPCLAPRWVLSQPGYSFHTHSLPRWAIPAIPADPAKPAEVQP